jgi:hypothetical protein
MFWMRLSKKSWIGIRLLCEFFDPIQIKLTSYGTGPQFRHKINTGTGIPPLDF